MIFVREDIPCRRLFLKDSNNHIEGIFLEISTRKLKWLLLGSYCNKKENIDTFLRNLSAILDGYISKYENLILLVDFNSEMSEIKMKEFCDTYSYMSYK